VRAVALKNDAPVHIRSNSSSVLANPTEARDTFSPRLDKHPRQQERHALATIPPRSRRNQDVIEFRRHDSTPSTGFFTRRSHPKAGSASAGTNDTLTCTSGQKKNLTNPLTTYAPHPLLPGSTPDCASAAQPALRLPVAHATTTGRGLPSLRFDVHPLGHVSHTARGGVDNQVDDSARRARSVGVTSATPPVAEWTATTTTPADRPKAHDRRRPPPPTLCLRNGGAGPAAHA